MRTKDDEKIAALFEATVKLVNDIGFAASSVAKIAREANVSPATIYVYYQNKEELLVSTYVEIKHRMSTVFLKDFDNSLPIRDIFRNVWGNMIAFVVTNGAYFRYAEQFANSPYSTLVDNAEVEQYFEPLYAVLQRGIEQKIIKPVNSTILLAFLYHPVTALANAHSQHAFELTEEHIETAFTLAWDAIKL